MASIVVSLSTLCLFMIAIWLIPIAMRSQFVAISFLVLGVLATATMGPTWNKLLWFLFAGVAIVGTQFHWRRRDMLGMLLVLAAFHVGFRAASWQGELQHLAKLRAQYPQQNLTERLEAVSHHQWLENSAAREPFVAGTSKRRGENTAYEGPVSAIISNQPVTVVNLDLDEVQHAYGNGHWQRSQMFASLHRVHGVVETEFQHREGFGVIRSLSMWPREEVLELPEATPQPQPRPLPPSDPGSPLPLAAGPLAFPKMKSLSKLHLDSHLLFIDPKSLGTTLYQPTSEEDDSSRPVQAVGFQPHAFRGLPELKNVSGDAANWKVTEVELVSLLKTNSPAVYQSELLPNLEHFTHEDVPTRPLDDFEATALEKLRAGADVVIDKQPHEIRMLGSLRSMRQCRECHDVQDGTLLGGFSYRLQREVPPPKPETPRLLSWRDPARGEKGFVSR